MKIIGLTGGIGTGKSTVARFLAELGAVILSADEVGHEVLKPGTEIWHRVVAAFGRKILTPDGNIDRNNLGNIVFSDSESLSRLNQIMHPRMYNLVKALIEEHRQRGTKVVVFEAPLLLEAGWISLVDEIWITTAPESTVLKRLKDRSEMPVAESLNRMRAQLSSMERAQHADVIINTNCKLDELKTRVEELWKRLELNY